MNVTDIIKGICRNDRYSSNRVFEHYGNSKEELDNNIVKNIMPTSTTCDLPLSFNLEQGTYYVSIGEKLRKDYSYPANYIEPTDTLILRDGDSNYYVYHFYLIS